MVLASFCPLLIPMKTESLDDRDAGATRIKDYSLCGKKYENILAKNENVLMKNDPQTFLQLTHKHIHTHTHKHTHKHTHTHTYYFISIVYDIIILCMS